MENLLADGPAEQLSEEALRKWRRAVSLIKNRRRGFRYVADLDKRSIDQERLFRRSVTNNFLDENLITEGAFGKVYKGQIWQDGNLMNVTIRRVNIHGQGDEISILEGLEHKNIVSILGHYDVNDEKVIIYHHAIRGTLDQHLSDPYLTWHQRLQICLGVARALSYIHFDVIHCDIRCSKIFLDQDWEPKIYGFELSTKYPQSWMHRLRFSHHFGTNNMTPKYDVYSFGVLLLEVLCGKNLVTKYSTGQEELDIDPNLRKQLGIESLRKFKDLAYRCLNQQLVERPTMDQIVKELAEVSELQYKLKNIEHPIAADEGTSSTTLKLMEFFEIPLGEIRRATNDFNESCFVGRGGYADVYRAELDVLDIQSLSIMKGKFKEEPPKIRKTVAIKKFKDREDEQGKQGFLQEIKLLASCKHPNIVSLLGFSRENDVLILVYEYALNGSLGDNLGSNGKTFNLTWAQRLQICLDTANGINYLHTETKGKPRIIHRDIKSDNILLDENLNAKVADFGLSKFHPMNQQVSTIYTKYIVGTSGYVDPEYRDMGKYKRESDIYSFGVVLFEVLSGSLAYNKIYTNENEKGLASVARRRFEERTLKELIDLKIIEEDDDQIFTLNRGPNQDSFDTFSKIAHDCVLETQAKRPSMEVVIKELQKAIDLQGETMVLSRFRYSDIESATGNFSEACCISLDTVNGTVYKAELSHVGNNSSLGFVKNNGEPSKKRITVAIKRITSSEGGQRKQGFFEEVEMRAYKHPNVVSLLGFCDEGDEMILVYEHVSDRSLDGYLKSADKMNSFTWIHRLHMCLEIARGLNHLHTRMVNPDGIMKNDIRSGTILLDEKRGAKIGYYVISKLHPTNQEIGMKVYQDPEGKAESESDIYSFGVVLFEIICGRVAYDPVYIKESEKGLAPIARQCFNDGTLERIMDPRLKEEIGEDIFTPNQDSLDIFLRIAYQCLGQVTKS